MKVWITKFALTNGISEKEAEICTGIHEKMIKIINTDHRLGEYYHGNDWHTSKKDAILRANEMRDRKIAAVAKQINKLQSLKFD